MRHPARDRERARYTNRVKVPYPLSHRAPTRDQTATRWRPKISGKLHHRMQSLHETARTRWRGIRHDGGRVNSSIGGAPRAWAAPSFAQAPTAQLDAPGEACQSSRVRQIKSNAIGGAQPETKSVSRNGTRKETQRQLAPAASFRRSRRIPRACMAPYGAEAEGQAPA
jgi:hypothetical protein